MEHRRWAEVQLAAQNRLCPLGEALLAHVFGPAGGLHNTSAKSAPVDWSRILASRLLDPLAPTRPPARDPTRLKELRMQIIIAP